MNAYSERALSYLDAGWPGVLPVPVESKFPPPKGYTGGQGADTDRETVTAWTVSHSEYSIALRMPSGVIGIDVDHYEKTAADGSVVSKRGGDTIAEYERKWGPLPATWRSSAREMPSGIRFFRVPEGRYATVLGDSVEIIQRHHRYAVVAPSVHSGTGRPYAWYAPDGNVAEQLPHPDELPMLPERWVQGLSEHVAQSTRMPGTRGETAALLRAIEDDQRPMCSMMERAAKRACAALAAAEGGSRHDTAMARTMRIVGLAAEGHAGGGEALAWARREWDHVTAGEYRDHEWDSLVDGAAVQASGGRTDSGAELDPCEGGSGLGITVVSAAARAAVTLIVEGVEQARACAEYAAADVTVIGMMGRESWRRDGVPVPELRVVSGTDVVIMMSPAVTRDLDTYSTAVDLGEACRAKGAHDARFGQPPGSRGAVISDYLDSLEEPERTATLAHIVEHASAKPAAVKPKPRRDVFGGADEAGLLPPNDTSLATTWADESVDVFRWLADDEGWMRFRLGRWEEVGSSVVGSHVGVFLDRIAGQYRSAAEGARSAEQAEQLAETSRMLLSNNKLTAVLGRASRYDAIHVQREQLDQHPRLWNAGNCVIDLETGETLEHDPGLMLTTGSDVPYLPDATCPRFDEFFADILPDADVRAFMYRLFGVAMFGEVRADAQVFPVLIGEGRNGKGALIRIMEKLFGRHAVKVEAASLLERRNEQHSQEVIKLRGKRLATAEETARGAKWNTSRIKSWTGGDILVGRKMHGHDEEFVPSHTLFMSTNHRPNVAMDENAFWMRYREIPFNVSVEGREDPTLEPHIIGRELPGVLNHLLAGVREYLSEGLNAPEAVLVATAEARDETNHLARFVEEMLIVTDDEDDRLLCTDVYDRARKWWSQNVQNVPIPADRGRNNFGTQLASLLGFTEASRNPRKAKVDGSVRLCWHRLRWLGEGGSEGPKRLPLSPLANTATGHIGNPDLAPASLGNPGPVADMEGVVADTVAEINDQEISESAGHGTLVALVAEVADINEGRSTTKRRDVAGRHADDTPKTTHTHSGAEPAIGAIGNPATETPLSTPLGEPVAFDLETADADQLRAASDPRAFVRIAGRTGPGGVVVDAGPDAVVESVLSSRKVIGHNIIHFDLPALARVDERVDLIKLANEGRVMDTMITESVLHPILNDKSAGAVAKAAKWFKLDAVCARRGIPGKIDQIARLAKQHGGYDAIPVDDPEYVEYCAGDVGATRMLAGLQAAEIAALSPTRREYLWREHRVHAIAAEMGAQGFLVDQHLLQRRFWQGFGRKNDLSRRLIKRYGIPTTKADGKPADSPAATKAGKEAILTAFASLGVDVDAMERTPKGSIAFGREPMTSLAEAYAEHPNAVEITALAETVADVNGVRTVYGTALEALHPDGRVHPEVATFQASGRWSVRKPGLTVFGKRGGKVIERAVFTAAPGHKLFAIDLSQIDARAIAVHSQDPDYLALFEPGRDAHEIFARMVWGDTVYDSDRKHYRQQIKAITHGMPYGMGAQKMSEHAGVPLELAQQVIETRRARFPRLVEWEEEIREEARATGRLDNGFGRTMLVDPDRAHTQAVALMGQSTARDLMMECLLRLPHFLVPMLRAQVHDEAVFEVPVCDYTEEIVRHIEKAFNFRWCPPGARLSVAVEAEAGHLGQSWADCY